MGKIIKILPSEVWDIIINPYKRDFRGIIFHHTAYANSENQGEFIERVHSEGQRAGYPPFTHGMGYHFIVNQSGDIETGKRWISQLHGAHCLGKNRDHVGIAFAGHLMIKAPTKKQFDSLANLLLYLGFKKLYLHHEFSDTLCPGDKFPFLEIKDKVILLKALNRLRSSKISTIKRWPYFNKLKP